MRSYQRVIVIAAFAMLAAFTLHTSAAETKQILLGAQLTAKTEVTVLVHNALPVTARFKLRRDGSDATYPQRPVAMRLISPNGAVSLLNRSIGGAFETFEIILPAAGGGNTVRNWKAEVASTGAGSANSEAQPVSGTVEFFTTGSQNVTIPAPAKFGVVQSDTITKEITMPFTGSLTIQANWDTDEFSVEAYQLKFDLYKGSTLLDSDTGYSRDSFIPGVYDSQRMKISYQVKAKDFQISGDWKIKVHGSTKGKVKNVDLKMRISDGLFE